VDHHDGVATPGGKSAGQRLCLAGFAAPRARWAQRAGHRRRVVDGAAVDQHDLEKFLRQSAEEKRQIERSI
jgi:hypothetical protein